MKSKKVLVLSSLILLLVVALGVMLFSGIQLRSNQNIVEKNLGDENHYYPCSIGSPVSQTTMPASNGTPVCNTCSSLSPDMTNFCCMYNLYEGIYYITNCQKGGDTSCNAGEYLETGGSLTSGNHCETCNAGYYCAGGTAAASSCGYGNFCPSGSSQPSGCGRDKYTTTQHAGSASECIAVPDGGKLNGNKSGFVCEENYYYNTNTNKCETCGDGYISDGTGRGIDNSVCQESNKLSCTADIQETTFNVKVGEDSGRLFVYRNSNCIMKSRTNQNARDIADTLFSYDRHASGNNGSFQYIKGVKPGTYTTNITLMRGKNDNSNINEEDTHYSTMSINVTINVTCDINTYYNESTKQCEPCDDGYTSDGTIIGKDNCTKTSTDTPTITAPCCVTNSDNSKETVTSLYGCQQALRGGANVIDGECPTSQTTPTTPTITAPCSKGYYAGGNNSCIACESGYYCANGIGRTKCPDNKTSNIKAESESDCYKPEADSSCQLSVTKVARHVSVDSDDLSNNSYYTVKVVATGKGCAGQKFEYSATNAKRLSKTSESNISAGAVYYFDVYPNQPCRSSTATVKLSRNGVYSGVSGSVTVATILTDWVKQENICEKNPDYTSSLAADKAGADHYYSDRGTCTNGDTGYTVKWVRKGCGTPDTPTPTDKLACYANAANLEDATAVAWQKSANDTYPYLIEGVEEAKCKASACYVNNDKTDYKWTTTKPTGYTKVDNILAKDECKPEEEACYVDARGIYQWGRYKHIEGYTLITSIKKQDDCKQGGKCYRDVISGEYIWTDKLIVANCTETRCEDIENNKCANSNPVYANCGSLTSKYQEISNIQDASNCKGEEESVPGCYIYKENYVWGDYSTRSGYTLIGSIEEEKYCKKAVNGCYLGPDGKYHIGDYSLDNDYSVADMDKCGSEIPVPPTAQNISNKLYIAMAILAFIGSCITFYAYKMRKHS